ncbi:hypothetical protein J5289_22115 [Rhizobium sp. B230/85]|uniref:hypothetical protein n=1 Tax=unclassified Rhizobium TaxID=2613769 RepID=UPI001ADC30B9|nr:MULTISPECIES: hypothetical protein [unclassified Rhizobium]MBO9135080.1 hypothetical protein [Rhizobium sp. B209b/85]QXZ98007.1 hypothetical protein J5289_22115 [Rhizobium sp. B230/85]
MTELDQGTVLDVAIGLDRITALVAGVVCDTIPSAFSDDKFTFVELSVLRHLVISGPTTFDALKRTASVTDELLTEVMWSLCDGGSIADENGRVSLTEKGAENLRHLQASTTSAYVDALQDVPPDILKGLAKSLGEVLRHVPPHPTANASASDRPGC